MAAGCLIWLISKQNGWSVGALATSMVTAGLVTHVTVALDIANVSPQATLAQNMSVAAQRGVIEATVRVGAETTIGGVEFDRALSKSFRTAATTAVGSVLASEIGDIAAHNGLKDGDVTKVIMHSVAGCAAAAVGTQDCIAGAIGSGLSELIGKPIAGAIENKQQQTEVIKLIAGTAAVLTRRTGKAVETAADTAATTHVFNYLSHAEMVEKLTAKQALANCDKPSAQCSSDQRNELTQTINKLDATDLLRDAELQLTCNQGSVAKCMQFVDASYEALKSYKNAELVAQSQGLSPEDYIASMGGKDAATGHAWHHVVEQTPNAGRFPAEAIHNPANIIKLPHSPGMIHNRISGFYSSKQPFTGGQTVRDWLSTKPYQEQFDFGVQTIKDFGGSQYLPPHLR